MSKSTTISKVSGFGSATPAYMVLVDDSKPYTSGWDGYANDQQLDYMQVTTFNTKQDLVEWITENQLRQEPVKFKVFNYSPVDLQVKTVVEFPE